MASDLPPDKKAMYFTFAAKKSANHATTANTKSFGPVCHPLFHRKFDSGVFKKSHKITLLTEKLLLSNAH
jgi:hypothetical protein